MTPKKYLWLKILPPKKYNWPPCRFTFGVPSLGTPPFQDPTYVMSVSSRSFSNEYVNSRIKVIVNLQLGFQHWHSALPKKLNSTFLPRSGCTKLPPSIYYKYCKMGLAGTYQPWFVPPLWALPGVVHSQKSWIICLTEVHFHEYQC